jgi:hypothetical protein
LRKNADGLRLVKEVLLQRYLESLLRLSKIPMFGACVSWRRCPASNLGQLVHPDIYNCNAVYCLQHVNRVFDYSQLPTLILIQKESQLAGPVKSSESFVPSTVVSKLRQLLEFKQDQEKKDESSEHSDLRSMILELKTMVNDLQSSLSVQRRPPNGNVY